MADVLGLLSGCANRVGHSGRSSNGVGLPSWIALPRERERIEAHK
ncbi:hypothetical protein BURMUCGD1_1015 [Burkholderia multivorans CGD1]|nr:hypothetical protein BURMUCGD1_1015 [Burkholderia multivorans CGD1]